jgi:integrase
VVSLEPILGITTLFHRCELTIWSPREAKSQRTIKSNLKVLGELVGADLVTDMTHGRLQRLVSDLFARGYAAGTVKRKMDMVGRALSMATVWEDDTTGKTLLAGKPKMPSVTARNSRDRVLSSEEEQAVFAAIQKRIKAEPNRDWTTFKALVRFLLDTGARLGEGLGVTAQDVERRRAGKHNVSFVHFRRYRTKNDKPRQVPLTRAVVAELKTLMPAEDDGRLFPLRPAKVWYMWDTIRDDLRARGVNVDDVVLHTLRHTCLTRLAKRLPIHKVSHWAGHSDIKVTVEHYAHLASDDLLDGLAVLEAA